MEVTNHSCLICSKSLGKWKKTEEVCGEGDSSELVFTFRRAFSIFCSLIGVDKQYNPEDQFDTLHKLAFDQSDYSNFETGFVKNGDSSHSPCCEKCSNMFEEILLLQKAIEESKIAQRQLARNLKRSLLESTDNPSDVEDVWTKIRHQLICYLKVDTSGSRTDHYLVKNIQNDAGASSNEMGEAEYEANHESEAEFSPVNEDNVEEGSCIEIEKNGRLDLSCDNISVSEVSTHIAQQVKMRKKREPFNADPRTHRTRKMEGGRNWRKLLKKTVTHKSVLTCVRPCSVVVKRLSKSDIASYKSLTQPPGKKAEVSSQVRKSKKKAFDFIRKCVTLKGNQNEEEKASKSRKKKVLSKQLDLGKMDENISQVPCDNLSDDEYLPDMVSAERNDESNSEKESEHPKHSTREEKSISDEETLSITNKMKNRELVGKKRRAHRSFTRRLRFIVVNKNILLCDRTLVTLSTGSLKCEAPGCFKVVKGRDFHAYQSILYHIKENHSSAFEDVQKCPLCSVEIHGARFRHHLVHDHQLVRVFCQVCETDLRDTGFGRHIRKSHKKEAYILYSSECRRDAQDSGIKTFNTNCKGSDGEYTPNNQNVLKSNTDNDNFRCDNGPEKSKEDGDCSAYDCLNDRVEDAETASGMEDRRKTVKVKGSKHCQKRNSEKSIDYTSTTTKKLKRGNLGDETFYRVSDSWMMYKSTPVLCSWTHFTCSEEACNEVINGTDYFAFEEVRRHVNDVHLKDTFDYEDTKRSCFECNQTFQNGYSFRYHIMRKHNYETCICTSCFKTVTSTGLQRHLWSHKSAEEKAAAIAAGVANPLEVEERKRKCAESLKGKFECTECGKQFNSMPNLQAHKMTHLPKSLRETFKCPEENCEVVVLSKGALRSHIERRHRPELASRPRICRICNARFHFRDSHRYRAHMLSHNNERPFVCEICGKGFVAKTGLQNHARAHSDERLFQCEFCTMSYKFPNNLTRHRQSAHKDLVPTPSVEERLKWTTRSEDRPDFIGPRIAYPCEYCEKVFPLRSRMTKHLPICVKRRVQGAQS